MIDLEVLVREAAEGLGITIESHSDGWLLLAERGACRAHIVGHVFPFNTAADAALLDDKCALTVVLASRDIPHVPHSLVSDFRRDETGLWKRLFLDAVGVEKLLVELRLSYPVVIKPVRGTNGSRVRRADDREACAEAMREILDQDGMAAASPFLEIESEYRIVVLRGEVLCTLDKIRGDDWRHNLSHGARAVVVADAPDATELATRAAATLGMELVTVDCVRVDGRWRILEINSGTKLVTFAKQSVDDRRVAVGVYRRILQATLAKASTAEELGVLRAG